MFALYYVHIIHICAFLQTNRHVTDLFTDLQDGLNLISLLEVLTGEHLVSQFWIYGIIPSWHFFSF